MNETPSELNITDDDIGRQFTLYAGRDRLAMGPVISPPPSNVPRGTIAAFSDKSRRRLVAYLTNAVAMYQYFGTLTIADDILTPAKFKVAQDRFMSGFMRYQRQTARAHTAQNPDWQVDQAVENVGSVSCCWFLEFQRRGAPHLHFFYTHAVDWRRAAGLWCDSIDQPWAFSTCSNFKSVEPFAGQSAYAAKLPGYASKGDKSSKEYQKIAPKGTEWGRWWGVRGLKDCVSATSRLEVMYCNVQTVKTDLKQLNNRIAEAVQQGEVAVIPWKDQPLGRSIFFRAEASPSTRARLYSGMARLMLNGGALQVDQGPSDDG